MIREPPSVPILREQTAREVSRLQFLQHMDRRIGNEQRETLNNQFENRTGFQSLLTTVTAVGNLTAAVKRQSDTAWRD